MVTIEKDADELEYLEGRKKLLLAQARILCEAYDAGTLKKLLDDFKGKTSDSQQPPPLRGVKGANDEPTPADSA